MKIAFLIPSFRNGGAERQFLMLARSLRRRGYDASFITYKKSKHIHDISEIQHHHIEKKYKLDFKFLSMLVKYVKASDYDIIVTCYQGIFEGPLLWGRLLKLLCGKIRLITAFRSSQITFSGKVIEQLTCSLSDAIIANNTRIIQKLRKISAVRKKRMKYIPNIADTKTFYMLKKDERMKQRRKYHGKNIDKTILICLGSYLPVKNYSSLLSVIIELKRRGEADDYHFSIYGDTECIDSQYELLKEQINSHKLQNIIHLNGPEININHLLNSCDALLLPSQHEGAPNVAIEAMLSRTPVIVSSSANYEGFIVDKINGYVYPTNNSQQLQQSVKEIKNNSLNLENKHIEDYINKHDVNNITEEYIKEFKLHL
jgi:glycosyltransferase involved in cell wall biosynthesis